MKTIKVEVRREHMERAQKARLGAWSRCNECLIAQALAAAGFTGASCGLVDFRWQGQWAALPAKAMTLVKMFDDRMDAEILARLPLTFEVEVPDA